MRTTARRVTVLPGYQAIPVEDRFEQTRRDITEAAVEAFVVHGYAATTMEAVAALAGVSPRTVYRHFGSKGALFAATVAVGAASFLEQLAAGIERWPLRQAILTAFAETVLEARDESRAIMHLATVEDEVLGHWLATSQRMLGWLGTILQKAAGPDDIDPLGWEIRAAVLLSAFNVAYQRWAAAPEADLMELVTHAVDTVLPALQPAPVGLDKGDLVN